MFIVVKIKYVNFGRISDIGHYTHSLLLIINICKVYDFMSFAINYNIRMNQILRLFIRSL